MREELELGVLVVVEPLGAGWVRVHRLATGKDPYRRFTATWGELERLVPRLVGDDADLIARPAPGQC